LTRSDYNKQNILFVRSIFYERVSSCTIVAQDSRIPSRISDRWEESRNSLSNSCAFQTS